MTDPMHDPDAVSPSHTPITPRTGQQSQPQPGQVLARGVARALADLGLASMLEMPLRTRLRADVMGLTRKGEIWIVECKSSRADFRSDAKWQGYLEWCDRYFWAVDTDFPTDLLPEGTGLFIADGFGAEMLREAPLSPLAPARRKALTLDFARRAALRLQGHRDPGVSGLATPGSDPEGWQAP